MARQKQYIGVRQRSDGRFEKRFTMDGKQYSVYGASAKECTEKEITKRQEIAAGTYKNNSSVTLDDFFKEWYRIKSNTLKSKTLLDYSRNYYKHISPVLGNNKVQKIERRQILEFQSKLKDSGFKSDTINYYLVLVHSILKEAVQQEIIRSNPADNIKILKKSSQPARETIHRALTVEETQIFMKYAKEQSWYYELYAFLLLTGLRVGEAAAMRWSDIDYKNNLIHVQRTVTYTEDGKKTTGTPKSHTSKRDIPLTDDIKKVLALQKAKQKAIQGKIQSIDNLLFTTITQIELDANKVNKDIEKFFQSMPKDSIEFDRFTVHALRDTFATRAIEAGMKPNTLKELLGHSNISMTLDLYAHVMENTKQDEMNMLHIAY